MLIEVRRFRLATRSDEEVFLNADRRLHSEFLYLQEGFVRGTTANAEGEWLSLLFWSDQDAADAAWSRAGDDRAATDFASLVDAMTVDRYSTLD